MKNFLFAAIITCFCGFNLFAQDNIVKANLLGLGFTSLNATYERPFADNMSVTLGLNGVFSFKRDITGTYVDNGGVTRERSAEARFKGFGITPGFRFYTGGNAPEDFYLEPFLRYYRYTIEVTDYEHERDNGEIVLVDGDGNITGIGGGLQIGKQWITSSNFVIDVHGGFGLASGKLEFSTMDEDLTSQEYADIKEEIDNDLEDATVGFLEDVVVTATDESASVNLDGALLPIIRFGVSLGYYF